MVYHHMTRLPRPLALLTLMVAACGSRAAESPERLLSRCEVTWDSPSRDAFDSMPLSGWRGAGANVWFSDGALRLYLSHAAAYDADDILRKLGALTLSVPGLDLAKPKAFRQRLDLAHGAIQVDLTAQDGTTLAYRLQFGSETLLIDAKASRPVRIEVAFGSWRAKPQVPGEDTVDIADNQLVAVHRNRAATRGAALAAEQKVPDKQRVNPTSDRVFGCALTATGGLTWGRPRQAKAVGWSGYEWPAQTVESAKHTVLVTLGAGRKADPATWATRCRLLLEPDTQAAVRSTANLRWEEFWRRSFVFVQPAAAADEPAFQVGRNYQLLRYLLACNQEGEFPLPASGGIFSVEPHVDRIPARLNNPEIPLPGPSDPDYQRTGPAFRARSQRWVGWPGVAAGDVDLLAPSIAFYRDRLPVAQARASALKASGAVYAEALSLAGAVAERGNAQGLSADPRLTHHFSGGLEHAWLALQSHLANGNDLRGDQSWILAQLRFFDDFYRARNLEREGNELDKDGKLVIQPANGLELAVGATNPIETVAALRALTTGLLGLSWISAPDREFLEGLRERLPELPLAQAKGFEVLSPATRWQKLSNGWELPELYAAWPYRLVGVTQPETLALARVTWNLLDQPRGDKRQAVLHKLDLSWQPTWVDAAAIGLTEEAQRRALAKLSDAASPCRFPAFLGPGHGWVPDLASGGSAMVGLQEMLVAPQPSATGKIYLLPAWPRAWDVVFRLRAPGGTLINGEVTGGKLVQLVVTPDERRKDIVLPEGWTMPAR